MVWISWAVLACAPGPVDFESEVLPVISKAGCNAAACHGSAQGRGGFRLSLFAGDVQADYDAIVHHVNGRRVDLVRHDESLLLLKPTGQLEHGGGVRWEFEGPEASLVQKWIAEGAPRGRGRQLAELKVEAEPARLLELPGSSALRVMAHFEGQQEPVDVTRLAVYEEADPGATSVAADGAVEVRRPGRHAIVVRFMDQLQTVHLSVPFTDRGSEFPAGCRENWIDELILARLSELRMPAAPPTDDATALRRLTLDLTGRLPEPEVVTAFLADTSADKWRRQVDQLLDSDAFVDYFAFRLGVMLRVRLRDANGTAAYHQWLKQSLAERRGWDQMAREMLTSTGDSHQVGAANFLRVGSGPREQAEFFSESLMGVRLRCANCHNHPLDVWTQDDYHGLSAIFARLDRRQVVKPQPRGEVIHPRTGQPATIRLPGGPDLNGGASSDEGVEPRQQLAEWLLAADNKFFARAMANRVWGALMGRGLIEPLDDLRQTNAPTHGRLLDQLAGRFAEQGYRFRPLIREIVSSAAYRRAGEPRLGDGGRYYNRAIEKQLSAEVLVDALADVTGIRPRFPGAEEGARAVQLHLPISTSSTLELLGRCPRDGSCNGADTLPRGLRARLHLINSAAINRPVRDGRLARLIEQQAGNGEIVKEFYLRALSRPPTARELEHWGRELDVKSPEERRARLEDFVWSLLNCREFSVNR